MRRASVPSPASVQQQAEQENQQKKQQKVLNLQTATSPTTEEVIGTKVKVRSPVQPWNMKVTQKIFVLSD